MFTLLNRYDAGLNSVVGPWYRTRTNFLFSTHSETDECYSPSYDNCNLAFKVCVLAFWVELKCYNERTCVSSAAMCGFAQTFYRYLWTADWITNDDNACPLPGQQLVDAFAGLLKVASKQTYFRVWWVPAWT